MSSKRRHNLTGRKRPGAAMGQFTLSKPDVLTKGQRARLVQSKNRGDAQQQAGGPNDVGWVLASLALAVMLWAIFGHCPPK